MLFSQEKPKRLKVVVDVSGSMYRYKVLVLYTISKDCMSLWFECLCRLCRFNGHDQRLERTMESALMVMEALEGFSERSVFIHGLFFGGFIVHFFVSRAHLQSLTNLLRFERRQSEINVDYCSSYCTSQGW
jgi:hypothetical protein